MSLEPQLRRAAAVLHAHVDVLEERVADDTAPGWAVRRGWDAFLLGLGEDDLAACERDAAAVATLRGAPPDLVALASEVVAVALESGAPRASAGEALPGASLKKSQQVAALVALCHERAFAPRRVVDVGAGTGHLTRALAQALGVEAVGLEKSEERLAQARAHSPQGARFEEVVVGASLVLTPGDLAVGLHACGALGDSLVEVAARDRVDLVLVACCPQKIPGARREALSLAGRAVGLGFARELLGLANSFEGSPDLDAAAVRVALRWLLRARGVAVRSGEEGHGLTPGVRRKLGASAERAFARRGLAPATEDERVAALAFARVEVGRARRRSLPRRLLSSALEMALALDRACALEEVGAAADVVRLFPRELSPRNLAVVARGT